MKHNIRLVIVVMFILLLLQTSYAYRELQVQDADTHGRFNFAEVGDVDGDGKDDLVFIHGNKGTLATGVSFSHNSRYSNRVVYNETVWHENIGSQLFLEDVDGDSADDIIFVSQEDDSSLVTVFISNGDGTFRDADTQKIDHQGRADYYYILGGV